MRRLGWGLLDRLDDVRQFGEGLWSLLWEEQCQLLGRQEGLLLAARSGLLFGRGWGRDREDSGCGVESEEEVEGGGVNEGEERDRGADSQDEEPCRK